MNIGDLDAKFPALEARYKEVQELLAQPETQSDPALVQRYGRESASLADVVETYRAWRGVRQEIADTQEMLGDGLDEEMRALAYEELEHEAARGRASARGAMVLVAQGRDGRARRHRDDPGGAGGDEAGLFAADLYRMYTRYADTQALERRGAGFQRERHRRLQRGGLRGAWQRRLLRGSSSRAAHIACSACPRPSRRGASTPRRPR